MQGDTTGVSKDPGNGEGGATSPFQATEEANFTREASRGAALAGVHQEASDASHLEQMPRAVESSSGDTTNTTDRTPVESPDPSAQVEVSEHLSPPENRSSSGGFISNMTKLLAAVASGHKKAPENNKGNQNSIGEHESRDPSGGSAVDILKQKSRAFKSVESDATNSLEQAGNGKAAAPSDPPSRGISGGSFHQKVFKSVESDVFHSLVSVASSDSVEALKPPAQSSLDSGEGSMYTRKRKAVPSTEDAEPKEAPSTEEDVTRSSSGDMARLFNSGGSTSEILKQEFLKSVVADELQSLNSGGNNEDVMAAPLARASSSSSAAFFKSMMGTFVGAEKSPASSATASGVQKTDWEAIQKQGLRAASVAAATAPDNTEVAQVGESAVMSGEKKDKPKRPPRKRKTRVPVVKNYFEPTDADILCGRGGRANNHPGNKKYLELKDQVRPRYTAASKAAKTGIAEEVVDTVIKEWKGRFLALDTKADKWYEIDRLEARRKCSQALREENTAEARAQKRAKYPKKRKADREREKREREMLEMQKEVMETMQTLQTE